MLRTCSYTWQYQPPHNVYLGVRRTFSKFEPAIALGVRVSVWGKALAARLRQADCECIAGKHAEGTYPQSRTTRSPETQLKAPDQTSNTEQEEVLGDGRANPDVTPRGNTDQVPMHMSWRRGSALE